MHLTEVGEHPRGRKGQDEAPGIVVGRAVATLAVVHHPELQVRLEALAGDQRAGVRSYALDRLRELDPTAAARIARDGLGHPSADIRAASVRALGPDSDPADVATLLALWRDPCGSIAAMACWL